MAAAETSGWSTASQTVLLGAAVFVSGQVIMRFIIEPILDQRRTIGEIAVADLFLANLSHVAQHKALSRPVQYSEDPLQSASHLRQLASRLLASLWTIPGYRLWSTFGIVPKRVKIQQASKDLVGWSNSLFSGEPHVFRDHLVQLLNIPRIDE
jgi:hypothetical protein